MNVRPRTVRNRAGAPSQASGGGNASKEDIVVVVVLLLQLLLKALREHARQAANTELRQMWVYLPLLRQLAEHPGITVNELARAGCMPKSQVSVLIARFARLGIVRKDADERDSRLVHVSITPEGRRQTRRWRAITRHALLRTLQPLSDDQRALIVEGLRTLLSALQPNAPHPFGVQAAVPQPREPRAQRSAAC
jgi:DNA-binding MarR family transcriptional regulator